MLPQFQPFQNIDLLLVGIVTAVTSVLGFTVFYSNKNSITNRIFLIFSMVTLVHQILNYVTYQNIDPYIALWFLRITIFLGIWHAFLFLIFSHVFPQEKIIFSKPYKIFVLPFTAIVSIITLTPLAFFGVETVSSVNTSFAIIKPISGIGMLIFGLTVLGLMIGAFYNLFDKKKRAQGIEKRQYVILIIGASIMFATIFLLNIIFPALLKNPRFVPLGPLFMLPFFASTAYAILRYRLLNVRIAAAEILVFLLVITSFAEILISKNITETVLRVMLFGLLLIFGVSLIKSVIREIKQREILEKLTKELAEANDKLKKLDQAKSEFISIASHQLRTPLTVIKGYVSLALEGTLGPITNLAKESLGKAAFSTEQLVKLVNELLDLSRIESGTIKYEFAVNDLGKIIDGVVDELHPQADEKHVTIRVDIDRGMPQFMFDRDKIREIVINVLNNAIKYTPKGKIIICTETIVKSAKKVVRLSIKDSGIGIAKEDLQKLFVKFGRSKEARTIDPSGMGLGLFFVKKVAEDHGGTAWVESEGLGKGSMFIVEIPFKQ